ncbi:NUDIX domain-containing protein [Methylacidiphilum caldifontis]|uniref:NUDIX hydrolase n=1 Tax=Methylacidiphilum caldifontis TaxID=2795386 RepID=A0A4Y8PGH5_9BACT|nr:NUDIX domain-containing protein [Methylacidiphilum caldifontis]QSR88335.1 NUDIX domain-containing protein [Methylacidiphilum caldifontis]TFE70738.1 NUDIX hydrolase [Methylacidiphilum caldifontis]
MKKIIRSAGLVIYKEINAQPFYLLLRAYRNWDFPKGTVQNGESDFQAALRETQEETGLINFEFPFNQNSKETEVYSKGKIGKFFIAQLKEGEPVLLPSPELGRPEHHEWRWSSYEDAKKLLPIHLIPILDWANDLIGSFLKDRENKKD